jgi:hypothetical protein
LKATGIDLNPTAALIAEVTANPPHPATFYHALDAYLMDSRAALASYYLLPDGATLRYCVHAGLVNCPGCGTQVSAWAIREQGRKRRCPACGGKLRFNLDTITGTEVISVVTTDGNLREDAVARQHQQTAAYETRLSVSLRPHEVLLPNKRILVWDGMRTADLFTPRNYSASRALHERLHIDGVSDETRRTLAAMLSASLAGSSRLIAYRDGLRGGGPAWSVPGFWVAPVHIEHNPLLLLDSWARRYRSGITRLWERLHEHPPATILPGPAQDVLLTRNSQYDLVFLDPPYGDSVPYLEYSALWNAFRARIADPAAEVVVSDRSAVPVGWEEYDARLRQIVAASAEVLKPDGRMLVTFNNLDGRAWASLLGALHAAGMRCASAHYVGPAVISAKAQFAPDSSYHGDFWCVYERGDRPHVPEAQWPALWQEAIPAGMTDPQRKRRLALKATLLANLPAEAVLKMAEVVK